MNVLSNAESKNAEMIREGIGKQERFEKLRALAEWQLQTLNKMDLTKSLKKTSDDVYLLEDDSDKK